MATIPEARGSAGGIHVTTATAQDPEAPELPTTHGGPGLHRVSRRPAGFTGDAVSEAVGVDRRTEGPALVRRRERPAERAALNPYRKFSPGTALGLLRRRRRLVQDPLDVSRVPCNDGQCDNTRHVVGMLGVRPIDNLRYQ